MSGGRILITGATGFVGRYLVRHFLSFDRPMTLAVRDVDNCPHFWRQHERIRIIEAGPIEAAPNLEDAVAGASIIIHLAGLAHVRHVEGSDNPFIAANTLATERLVKAAVNGGMGAFVHMSSVFAITDNSSRTVVDDRTDRMPSTSYGRSKRMSERYVLDLAASGILGVVLRPTLIIAADAGGNWRALQRLAASNLPLPFATVRNKRSLLSVDSLVEAIDHLCSHRWSSEMSGSYCLADKGSVSLSQIIASLRVGMGMPLRLFPFPPSIIQSTASLIGQKGRISGLLGDLEVDASRFCKVFGFDGFQEVQKSIQKTGALFKRSQNEAIKSAI